jgi:formylglycine-generating enzyme required for sulfatase activity
MGSADSDPDASEDEKPQHRVYLDAFWLGKYPITNAQYRVFVRATGYQEPYGWERGSFPPGKADHPVVGINWSDVLAFCEWAAQASRRPVRFLTEAEWEKGARGTDGRLYPWGNRWQPGRCNTLEAGIKDTTPVGRYPSDVSPYGAYDMAGNVREWTSTLYKPYPYRPDDGREVLTGAGGRVLRGGVWWSETRSARAAARYYYRYDRFTNFGFRVGVAAPSSLP